MTDNNEQEEPAQPKTVQEILEEIRKPPEGIDQDLADKQRVEQRIADY